jgi:hypothetical protein
MELNTISNTSIIVEKPRKSLWADDNVSPANNRIFTDLIDEAGEEVFRYLSGIRPLKGLNILLISSIRHYLYDSRELEQVDMIINLRILNGIKHIGYFLQTMNQLLPTDGYFIGCFLDYSDQKKEIKNKPTTLRYFFLLLYMFMNRVIPRIPVLNMLYSIMSHGKIKCLITAEAVKQLEDNGFKIVDKTCIDGVTYFVCQKTKQSNRKSTSIFKILNDYKVKSRIINV